MGGPPAGLKPAYSLAKWWKSFVPAHGLVVRVQSPYRQDHVGPFLRHLPISFRRKITENFFHVAPAFTLLGVTVWWADNANAAEHRAHRS